MLSNKLNRALNILIQHHQTGRDITNPSHQRTAMLIHNHRLNVMISQKLLNDL